MMITQTPYRQITAVAVLAVLAQTCAWAAPAKIDQREVNGRGENRQMAILTALVEAVQQVNGVRLDQKTVVYRQYTDALDDLKETFKHSLVGSGEIRSASRGVIDSYQILSETEDPKTKMVQVRLNVSVAVWDPTLPDRPGHRKVIAILPFRAPQAAFQLLGSDVQTKDLNRLLCQGLVVHIVQSRKFTVLDRDFLAELVGEQDLIKSENAGLFEQVRLGQRLGADFLVVGTIEDVRAGVRKERIPGMYRDVDIWEAKTTLSYRVVNVATGKIHWADTFRQNYGNDDFALMPADRRSLRIDELLVGDAATSIANAVIEGVFPIRVVKVSGEDIILNQGGTRTKVGDEYDLFNLGEELVDPDTGETLERQRTHVARVRIERVTPKVSYGKIVNGDLKRIIAGESVCCPCMPNPVSLERR